MNYIAEINSFYMLLNENHISSTAQAMWHLLMSHCNRLNWKNEFSISNIRLADELGVSRQTLDKTRNVLVQKGLITYKKGSGNNCGTYTVTKLTQRLTQGFTQELTQELTQKWHSGLPLDKHKHKPKQSVTNVTSISFDDFSPTLAKAFAEFEIYRKEIKKPLTQQSFAIILNKFKAWNYTDNQIIECLNNSIMNHWQGIFELKPSQAVDPFLKILQNEQSGMCEVDDDDTFAIPQLSSQSE